MIAICKQLNYEEPPKFCGGDNRTTNILVQDGSIQAIIDFEWASGGDPVSHIGGWSAWNNDQKYLDYFLEGYEPDNLKSLRKIVLLYEVDDAINTILSYRDMGDQKGIRDTQRKLEKVLMKKLWQQVA